MSDTPSYDVVIAGGGMAGLTLALALARSGFSIAVVESEPYETQLVPAFDGRASAIAYAAFRQWRVLGAAEAMAAHAQPIYRIQVTDGRSPGAAAKPALPVFLEFEAEDISDRAAKEPLGWMLENRHIRLGLTEALKTTNVTVIAPRRAVDIEVSPLGAEVMLDNGQRLRCQLAVGCEGRRSPLREAAGIGVTGWSYKQTGMVATVALEHDHQGVAFEHFLPTGPFAILPLPDRRASLVWSERPREAEALQTCSVEAFESILARRFGDYLGRPKLAGPRFAYPLSLQMAEAMYAPRLALVGDSAHGIHPIAGQGLNLGLKDVAALAEVLVEARRLGEDIGSELVLERYARWRRFDTMAMAAVCDLFVRAFSNDNPLIRLARDASIVAASKLPVMRRVLAHDAGGAFGDTPKLLRGLAL